ncbi:unnamed protein product [Cyberlindnera jadinii]|uniref:Uncharacterized protein n=1 Tax=Cyberlindnera jadinii (strain ATCC 18201 / CBS 1600 / BCRC 20928 / JCM 3617 / NBRC 0987 / NRRL Y-1542) TaxID=983966 RepID=A0A0H5BYX4_CYBJN|nr:hypothetical protein CYBJADRAFT_151705 [Cyberlindnera jadinii NRRL Y-1542]ODV72941.1 hypothetical protein CYBJADRAFT_151705 [Cyberlindnera jadinii NRRL Y-1542]CEP20397.1 unnamed protein product [Cyberlindnera jadinii]
MRSQTFHRFVRKVYYKVNGLDPAQFERETSSRIYQDNSLFKPSPLQKFRAWRALFVDEMRSSVGLSKRHNV